MTTPAYVGAIAASQQSVSAAPGAGLHRYWRVLVTAIEGGYSRIGIAEIEFWSRRYAQRASGTYSTSGSLANAGAAFNGVRESGANAVVYWISNTGDIWLQVDAGAGNEFDLAAVVIWRAGFTASASGSHIAAFDVQYSDDGASWTTLWSESGSPLIASSTRPGVFVNPYFSGDPTPVLDPAIAPQHWYKLDEGAFSDISGTPAIDGAGIRQLTNHGSAATDFSQSVEAVRPTFKTGGLNGKPFLRASYAAQQRFDDIAIAQPSGGFSLNPYLVAAVTDNVNPTNFPALLGATPTYGGKVGFYFRSEAEKQIHLANESFRFGTLGNPQILVLAVTDSRLAGWQNGAYSALAVSPFFTATEISTANVLWNDGVSGDGYFDGDVYEFMYAPGAYNEIAAFRVSEYLNARYGGIY